MSYTVRILNSDLPTLAWLSARGYDGGFSDLASYNFEETATESTFTFSEQEAWKFSDNINDDPDAFLSCCGSSTLADALIGFWNRIV